MNISKKIGEAIPGDEEEGNFGVMEVNYESCQVRTINPLILYGGSPKKKINYEHSMRREHLVIEEIECKQEETARRHRSNEELVRRTNEQAIWIDDSDEQFLSQLMLVNDFETARVDGERRIDRYIRAGTKEGLTRCLVELYWTDWEFVRSYLAAFREFHSAGEFFNILQHRFHKTVQASTVTGWHAQIQIRIIDLLRVWIDTCFERDLAEGTASFRKEVSNFLESVVALQISKFSVSARAQELLLHFTQRKQGCFSPLICHQDSLQLISQKLCEALGSGEASACQPCMSLTTLTTALENVLQTRNSQKILAWILRLIDGGFLTAEAIVETALPPVETSPSYEEIKSTSSPKKRWNLFRKKLTPRKGDALKGSPKKAEEESLPIEPHGPSSMGRSFSVGGLNPYAEDFREEAEAEESIMMSPFKTSPMQQPNTLTNSKSGGAINEDHCLSNQSATAKKRIFSPQVRRNLFANNINKSTSSMLTSSSTCSSFPALVSSSSTSSTSSSTDKGSSSCIATSFSASFSPSSTLAERLERMAEWDYSDPITLPGDSPPSKDTNQPSTPSRGGGLIGSQFELNKEPSVLLSPRGKRCIDIDDLSAEAMASALRRVNQRIFVSIGPEEFSRLGWLGPLAPMRAPHVYLMTQNFNNLCFWVATQVLTRSTVEERVKVISKMLDVAQELRLMEDWQSLMAIMGGLQMNVVGRLKATWQCLSAGYSASFRELCKLCSAGRNYKLLRQVMEPKEVKTARRERKERKKKENEGLGTEELSPRHSSDEENDKSGQEELQEIVCVPYLGLFTRDMVWVAEGNGDIVIDHQCQEDPEGESVKTIMHSVTRIMLLGNILRRVDWHQERCRKELALQDSMMDRIALPLSLNDCLASINCEDTLYELSFTQEPIQNQSNI